MDPFTVFIATIVLTLLNGGVLGFLHRDVAPELRASAVRWRIGTLLLAGGLVCLSLQRVAPPGVAIPLGNAFIVAGIVEYWLALELFDGRRRSKLAWVAPPVLGALLWVFEVPWPHFGVRSVITSFSWATVGLASARSLWRGLKANPSSGRRVLLGIYVGLTLAMSARGVYFLFGPGREQTVLDPDSLVNALSPLVASVLPIIGTTAFLLMCSDRLRRQLEHAASTDALTELANRRTLSTVGAGALARARAASAGLGVAVVDVDHFKSINDRFGHDVGDEALRYVAARLKHACRAGDFPARQGGEEFVVVFERVDQAQAAAAAERLRRALADQAFEAGPQRLTLTASFGVAVLSGADGSFDDLLRRADQALYRAKQNGRNRVELADAPTDGAA